MGAEGVRMDQTDDEKIQWVAERGGDRPMVMHHLSNTKFESVALSV